MRFTTPIFFLMLFALAKVSGAECCYGRLDVGPAYVRMDILESGKTQRTLDLYAVRADATLLIYKGLCLKPWFLGADGKANLNSAGIGIGYCIPLHMLGLSCYPSDLCIIVTPSIGYTQTRFNSRVPIEFFGQELQFREKFISHGVYGCLEICWTFWEKWRLSGQFTYTWSHVKTTIRPLFTSHDHTSGPNYAISLERDILDCLSINIGAAYNISLSKERHGLRGTGVKLGLAYWF
jgi:hypothetical protein